MSHFIKFRLRIHVTMNMSDYQDEFICDNDDENHDLVYTEDSDSDPDVNVKKLSTVICRYTLWSIS